MNESPEWRGRDPIKRFEGGHVAVAESAQQAPRFVGLLITLPHQNSISFPVLRCGRFDAIFSFLKYRRMTPNS